MSEPDETDGQHERFVLPPPQSDQDGGDGWAVGRVVADGAETGAAQVADHDQVRQQNGYGHQPPGAMGGRKGDEASGEQNRRFEAEPAAGAGNNGSFPSGHLGIAPRLGGRPGLDASVASPDLTTSARYRRALWG